MVTFDPSSRYLKMRPMENKNIFQTICSTLRAEVLMMSSCEPLRGAKVGTEIDVVSIAEQEESDRIWGGKESNTDRKNEWKWKYDKPAEDLSFLVKRVLNER